MGSYGIVNIRAISSKNLSYDHRIFDIVGSNEDNIQKLFIINSARSLYNFIKFKQLFVVVRVDFNLVQTAFYDITSNTNCEDIK